MLYIAIVDDEMDICVQIEQFVHRYAKGNGCLLIR